MEICVNFSQFVLHMSLDEWDLLERLKKKTLHERNLEKDQRCATLLVEKGLINKGDPVLLAGCLKEQFYATRLLEKGLIEKVDEFTYRATCAGALLIAGMVGCLAELRDRDGFNEYKNL